MAGAVDICNSALQKLGAKLIVSLTENSTNARACNASYDGARKQELRLRVWNFAIKRATLAADATAPDWGRAYSFQLPSDFLRLAPDYPEDLTLSTDWQIEGKKILTDDSGPLYLRYVYNLTDVNTMDPLFQEALAWRIAGDLAETLTQSNSKIATVAEGYKQAVNDARRTNALENRPQDAPTDEWITARQ